MTEPLPKIRLYLDVKLKSGAEIGLSRDRANYLFNVMRLGVGAPLLVFNGEDGEWRAEVVSAGKRAGVSTLLEQRRPPEIPPDLWLVFAPIKKARTDFIAEKACEMGCRRLAPVFTRFTNSERVNTDRLRAHAVEAAEQCGMVFVPEVSEPTTLERLLEGWDTRRRLIFCDETRNAAPLAASAPEPPAAILVGPEGGFAADETAKLRALDFVTPAALGPRVLRADTAAVAALAIWQARRGDW
ncbi:MAG: 16S rRNA (uracil(1498)-N(3))-methyltransferase [Neomegalonema sp.]